ncbi:MAG: hypothetical protein K8M05_20375, partial [Deltaproteobacteria bacterium]|nr:hypothetical protein [Kofleriaceae bacterium]
ALVGAAGSARALLPGDSVSLSLHAGAAGELGVDVSGRGLGAGFDVGGGFEYIRNVTVSGVAGGKVRVSVGFEHESSSKAGASGTAMYTKLGGGIASASSDGEAREYVLDPRLPDYDACYAKILGVWTRDGLHALDADPAVLAHRTKAITSTAARDATTGAVSLVGAGVEGGASTFGASSLTVDANGVSGERSGGQSADFGLGVGDARPFRRTDTHTATASVDADGQLSADLETRSSETDLGHTIGHAKDIVGGWLGFDERDETVPSGKEVLTGVLARSPGERLAQLLSTTYTRLSGYHLSPADVTVLVARARDEERWLRCARSASAVVPMRVLRAALVAELPDPEVDVDASDAGQRARAIELAHARAIADFMKHAGGSGMEALPHVLRRWGESSTREGTGAALGVRFEWPASLDHEHERLDRVVAELRDLEATYAGLLGKPGAKDAANAIAGRIRVGLYTVREAVRSSTDIHSERARAEMLDQLSRYETVAVTAHDELLAQLDATGPLESSEAGVPASAPTAPSERPMA